MPVADRTPLRGAAGHLLQGPVEWARLLSHSDWSRAWHPVAHPHSRPGRSARSPERSSCSSSSRSPCWRAGKAVRRARVSRSTRRPASSATARTARGADRSAVGFDLPLPDLSDCNFTREPDADWYAVVHDGGPVRAFNRLMPSFAEALTRRRDHRRDRLRARLLRQPRVAARRPELPARHRHREGVPGGRVPVHHERGDGQSRRGRLQGDLREAARRAQPGRGHHPVRDARGRGRRLGRPTSATSRSARRAPCSTTGDSGTILSAAVEVVLPTGNEDRGFGSGHTTVEGFLAFGQALPADGFIQAQAGVGVPTNGDTKEVFWRLVGGKTFTQGRVRPLVVAHGRTGRRARTWRTARSSTGTSCRSSR